ncbi:MAG: hypothetical protein JSW70_08410 [Syntrophobacterales bacterium]|nr:MAG: hypothetical protein JSW70_08410 [Syntrophobacterales bacterium]
MRFNIGDKVRHRGLKWLLGTVEEIYEASRAHSDEGRYYLYKVSLKQGQHYTDRGCEWELIPGEEENPRSISAHGIVFEDNIPPELD